MYSFFQHLHSGFRYIVFILVLIAIVQSLIGWLNQKPYTESHRKTNLFALISVHTQLLIGIILFFISPLVSFSSDTMKNDVTRYFTVEHWVGMVIAITLITIGHSKSKKIILPESKHRTIAIFYIIAFLIIIATILAGHLPLFGG
ncbi:cytochrome B [Mucilaginibacter sp. BJC16-A38]|uniref:cytochrome B n=1 Tax=Mucilaginibacter phenanthrenivorans TaxID=1234842 RepID=UPI0021570B1C|nr:cytochrome B [Mucilaginibacter phenanthrenivorans]MCR8561530.1 cytochrome B [Mucilaginibacter phenanthrenivorans]